MDFPFDEPYYLSGGRLQKGLDCTIVEIHTDAGIVGIGESCPWGNTYLPAFALGIRAGLEILCPVLIGENPLHIDCINRTMNKALCNQPYIKAAIDVACWDILARKANLPLYALLGGKLCDSVPLQGSSSFSMPPSGVVQRVRKFRERGYAVHTIKIGGDTIQDSMACIAAVLEDAKPDERFTFDANGHWLPGEAAVVMNSVRDSRVMFEQVCRTMDECGEARQLSSAPMTIDESVETLSDLRRAHAMGVAQRFGLKLGRIGGLSQARAMRDFCVAHGIQMNTEVTGGSIIGDTAAVHLAIATPPEINRATWDCTQLHGCVTATGGFKRDGGRGIVSDKPGLGLELVPEVVGEPVAVYEYGKGICNGFK